MFGGILAGTESWACSVHLAQPDQAIVDADAMLIAARGPVEAWFERAENFINSTARMNFIKLNEVNKVNGKYVDQGVSHTYFHNPMLSPDVGNVSAPPQLSLATTWHTDRERGRASKGRIYAPACTQHINTSYMDDTGHLNNAAAQSVADVGRLLVQGLNDSLTPLVAVVWSQIGQEARAIEQVSCGRLVDTQLRRRKSLTEDRVFSPTLVTAP